MPKADPPRSVSRLVAHRAALLERPHIAATLPADLSTRRRSISSSKAVIAPIAATSRRFVVTVASISIVPRPGVVPRRLGSRGAGLRRSAIATPRPHAHNIAFAVVIMRAVRTIRLHAGPHVEMAAVDLNDGQRRCTRYRLRAASDRQRHDLCRHQQPGDGSRYGQGRIEAHRNLLTIEQRNRCRPIGRSN